MPGAATGATADFADHRASNPDPAGRRLAGASQEVALDIHRDPFRRPVHEHPSPGPAPQESHFNSHER